MRESKLYSFPRKPCYKKHFILQTLFTRFSKRHFFFRSTTWTSAFRKTTCNTSLCSPSTGVWPSCPARKTGKKARTGKAGKRTPAGVMLRARSRRLRRPMAPRRRYKWLCFMFVVCCLLSLFVVCICVFSPVITKTWSYLNRAAPNEQNNRRTPYVLYALSCIVVNYIVYGVLIYTHSYLLYCV